MLLLPGIAQRGNRLPACGLRGANKGGRNQGEETGSSIGRAEDKKGDRTTSALLLRIIYRNGRRRHGQQETHGAHGRLRHALER